MRPYPKDKNPNHPSALRLNDINPGRKILWVGPDSPAVYEVMSRPFLGYLASNDGKSPTYPSERKHFVALLRNQDGRTRTYSLGDMGVIRYGEVLRNRWNTNFIIDVRKAHLLGRTSQSRRPFTFYPNTEEEYEHEDEMME